MEAVGAVTVPEAVDVSEEVALGVCDAVPVPVVVTVDEMVEEGVPVGEEVSAAVWVEVPELVPVKEIAADPDWLGVSALVLVGLEVGAV